MLITAQATQAELAIESRNTQTKREEIAYMSSSPEIALANFAKPPTNGHSTKDTNMIPIVLHEGFQNLDDVE